VMVSGRSQAYQGPSYNLPTGPGQYVITGWGMQKDDASITGILQIRLICATATDYLTVQTSGFGVTMSQSVWTMFSATVDTSVTPATTDCLPNGATPGLVKSAVLYLNQGGTGTPSAYPDLYLDDVVIQVTDGHNLIGNPNFEAGFTDGWTVSSGQGS